MHKRLLRWLVFNGSDNTLRYASGEVGNVDTTTVVVTFSKPVTAAGDDYSTGVTITVAGSSVSITSGTRQADTRVVHYVIGTAVANGDAVTWAYNGATGKITDADGKALATVTSQTVTNNVAASGMALNFSINTNSGYVALGV